MGQLACIQKITNRWQYSRSPVCSVFVWLIELNINSGFNSSTFKRDGNSEFWSQLEPSQHLGSHKTGMILLEGREPLACHHLGKNTWKQVTLFALYFQKCCPFSHSGGGRLCYKKHCIQWPEHAIAWTLKLNNSCFICQLCTVVPFLQTWPFFSHHAPEIESFALCLQTRSVILRADLNLSPVLFRTGKSDRSLFSNTVAQLQKKGACKQISRGSLQYSGPDWVSMAHNRKRVTRQWTNGTHGSLKTWPESATAGQITLR